MDMLKMSFIKHVLMLLIIITSFPAFSGWSITFEKEKEKEKEKIEGKNKNTVQVVPIEHKKPSETDDKANAVELLFEPYKENYFLFLSTRNDSKFQISFKYKLFTSNKKNRTILGVELPAQKSFWDKLYFGYTQKSIWDWLEDSAPFEDHNFNPELFWCSDDKNCNTLDSSEGKENLMWKIRHYAGYEHESNGREGPSSRSWNRLYYRPIFWRGAYGIAPKVWLVTSESEIGNGDYLSQYIGYFELDLFARHDNEVAYGATFRYAEKGWSVLTDFSIPQKEIFSESDFNPYWYIQLFSGYAEDLLKYNEKRNVLRIGLRLTL